MTFPNVPSRRRAIPKPFSRPSITVSAETKKDWQQTIYNALSVGDTVSGRGRVNAITRHLVADEEGVDQVYMITIQCGHGLSYTVTPNEGVHAFTQVFGV